MRERTMNIYKKPWTLLTLAILMLCSTSSPVQAQDAHFSQFYASELSLNPAMTGMFTGDYRVHLHYRRQWVPVLSNPFETTILSYDQPIKRFGLGVYVTNFRAGSVGMNFFNAALSVAYEISIDPQRVHHLTTGIQLGIIHKSFDPGRATYDNQYDTAYAGGSFDPGTPSGEAFESASLVMPDVNFGIFYFNEKRNAKFNPYAAISGFHLTQPKESFYDGPNRLAMRFVGYAGTKIKLDKIYSIEPQLLYMRQTNDNELQIGCMVYYNLEGSNTNFFAGPYYRGSDALILHLGGTYEQYIFRLSYDFNVSKLRDVSDGRGGFEFSITYTKQKARYLPSIL